MTQAYGETLIEAFHRELAKHEHHEGYFFFFLDLNNNHTEIEEFLTDAFNWEITLRKLDLTRQRAITNKKFQRDKYLTLFNALFVKFVICLYEKSFDIWDKIEMGRDKYGKPFLHNRNYAFNLSDEDGVVSLAIDFSGKIKEIGVDLANPNDITGFNLQDLKIFYRSAFRSIFTTAEVDYLDKLFGKEILSKGDQLNFLSHFWALKESYTKYLGVGLMKGLSKYEFLNIRMPSLQELKSNAVTSQDFTFFPDWKWMTQENGTCFDDKVSITTSFLLENRIISSIVTSASPLDELRLPLATHINPFTLLHILKDTPTKR